MSARAKFVLFPLGQKRYALSAGKVKELAQPDELQTFPHCTPLFTGVLVRRGRIVPVCDVAPVLVGPGAPARKFYLIAERASERKSEWTAIPVSGECELIASELLPPTGKLPAYIAGLLSLGDEIVEVVDLDKLAAAEVSA